MFFGHLLPKIKITPEFSFSFSTKKSACWQGYLGIVIDAAAKYAVHMGLSIPQPATPPGSSLDLQSIGRTQGGILGGNIAWKRVKPLGKKICLPGPIPLPPIMGSCSSVTEPFPLWKSKGRGRSEPIRGGRAKRALL